MYSVTHIVSDDLAGRLKEEVGVKFGDCTLSALLYAVMTLVGAAS